MPTTVPRPRRRKPKRRFHPEVLTDEEVKALMGALAGQECLVVRTRALLGLLYRGGLRISEALSLCPKDLDLLNGTARVLFGKGGRARTVGVDEGALVLLREWLVARAALGLDARAPLFCTRYGGRLTTAWVRRLLPGLARKAGIAKRVHAHGFRHTHAAQLRSEGVDIGIISKQLGHTSILTTVRYLDHIAPTAVIEAMRSRVWSA
jgi:site-specific recombinase XerD